MFRNGERMGTIKFTQFQGRLFDAYSFELMNSYIQGCCVSAMKYIKRNESMMFQIRENRVNRKTLLCESISFNLFRIFFSTA